MPTPTPTPTPPTVPYVPAPHGGRDARRVAAALLAGVLAVAVLFATYVLAVLEPTGRRVDDAVMTTAMRLGATLRPELLTVLDAVAVPTVALAVAVLAGLALARGQARRAAAVVALVLGSQALTQVLKALLPRSGDAAGNSLPSGHVTLVVALGVALVLAVPRAGRVPAALVAGAAAALAGVATMVAGWHRPSDLVAAVAVVAGVAALLALVDALWPRRATMSGPAGTLPGHGLP